MPAPLAEAAVEVTAVRTGRDRSDFIELPWRLYAGDPRWVAPLRLDVRERLDRKRNPFFLHSDAELFVARRGGLVVGRIAAIENRRHLEKFDDGAGFYGWFESENDPAVSEALFSSAQTWLRERGMTSMRGPANFSLNEEAGLLVKGHEFTPTLLSTYNPPWYADLHEQAGLAKVMDLFSFDLPVKSFGDSRIGRIAERVAKRENATVRSFRKDDFAREIEHFQAIYNDAWSDNWGFVPMTDEEIRHMAKSLKPVLEPRLACFVEVGGEPVGFSLVLPDANSIIKRLNGRLFPFGIVRLLLGLRRVPGLRLLAMGVRRDFHNRGLDAVLYHDNFVNADALGKVDSDIGWVLESNTVMINTIEKAGGTHARTHRLYEGAV